MDQHNNHLNASDSADAPPVHSSAGHSPAALSSASSRGPLTHTHAATPVSDQHASSRTLLADPAVSLAFTPASVASSLSGHKRAAADQPGVESASAAAADGPAVPSLLPAVALSSSGDESSRSGPQSKKHRGGSAQTGRSQARAAVTAGVDPQRADPIGSAATHFASSEHSRFAQCMAAEPSPSSAPFYESKEASHVAGSASVDLVAAATDPRGSSVPRTRPCPFDDGKILWLVVNGLGPAEAELQQLEERDAPEIVQATQLRAEAEAELQAILALPAGEQGAFQEQRVGLQEEIISFSRVLDRHASSLSRMRGSIDVARAAITERPVPLQVLGRLCETIGNLVAQMSPLDPPNGLRAWMLRVDLLFTQIADRLPRLTLTSDECRELLFAAIDAGALQPVPVLFQQPNMHEGCDQFCGCLVHPCLESVAHCMSHQPWLRLFRYGLDPTLIDAEQSPLSALQLARAFIRAHPPPGVDATALPAAPASASSASAPVDLKPIHSILAELAIQQREPTWEAELIRRADVHAQFMHALLPAWLSHSHAVLALLSSPSVLIPDLAAIVGRYCGFEGLPAEVADSVDEDDAETQADQP